MAKRRETDTCVIEALERLGCELELRQVSKGNRNGVAAKLLAVIEQVLDRHGADEEHR